VRKKGRRIFTALLISSWFGFMALAGFFIPSFLSQLPLFRVKEIVVEGIDRIDVSLIRETIEEMETDPLFLEEEELLSVLSIRSQGRIKKVFLSKDLGLEGISLRIRVVERKPVARVLFGGGQFLIDAEGVLFKPLAGDPSDLPLITTYDLDVLQEHFPRFYTLILSFRLPVERILVKKDRVIVKMEGKTVILPPLDTLPDAVSDRIKMIYNFQEEKVDLRYDRFILVRN